MDLLLDDDIYTNNIEYFFSLHGPRFEHMNNAMARSLGKRFKKEFRPIRILNAWPGRGYDSSNYVVLNAQGYKLAKTLKKPVVFLPDYEDLNAEFAKSNGTLDIAQKLHKKQSTVFVYPFTTSFLDLPDSIFTVIGPMNVETYDNKVNQLKLFEKLGLPHNKAQVFENEEALLMHADRVIPCYISASYTSGGNENGLIYDKKMLHEFLSRVRPINKNNGFICATIFKNIALAPNVNALVTNEGVTYVLVISDQILHGNRYLGNVYPSAAKPDMLRAIKSMAMTVGQHLAGAGYRGLFGCDFLINKNDEIVIVDLNPRHQGGYACNGLALEHKGISLTDIELATSVGKDAELSQPQLDEELGFAWSHSKLLPPEKGQVICSEYSQGSVELPFEEVGETFLTEFYKKGSVFVDGYVGCQVQTAKDRTELESKMLLGREKFDAKVFGL
jgi:hypothetical protein